MARQKNAGSTTWHDPAGVENAAPEQRLLASLIRLTIHDARAGDAEALDWLLMDAPEWLDYVVPEHLSTSDIHNTLLRIAGCRESILST